MQRTKTKKKSTKLKKVDAILTSDWHLREDTPKCRTDDLWETQWSKVDFIRGLQEQHNCPVYHAGDLFHHWKASPRLITEAIRRLPEQFYTVFGNHDLPQHNIDLADKSGVTTLVVGKHITLLVDGHWMSQHVVGFELNGRRILVIHKFVYNGRKRPWKGCKEANDLKMFQDYPDFDLIVSGDHHKSFTAKKGKRLLVNPGALTRQAADQEQAVPTIYLWSARENSVQRVAIPHSMTAVEPYFKEQADERDRRMEAFVSRLTEEWDVSLSFKDNMNRFIRDRGLKQRISKIILKAIDHVE